MGGCQSESRRLGEERHAGGGLEEVRGVIELEFAVELIVPDFVLFEVVLLLMGKAVDLLQGVIHFLAEHLCYCTEDSKTPLN